MKSEPSPIKPGDMIAGKYRVDRILGQGGMGVVVAATHIELREVRALKFLLASTLADKDGVERFRREARAVLKLKSEHVARLLDVGKHDNGAPYMVMEYLRGTDLGEALKQHGAVSMEHAILYVVQAMDAVAEAHAKGIIHRDLKPANLFLTTLASGMQSVKVLDFGISKLAKESKEELDMTKTHTVLGSPQYMSPEQMRASRDVDTRTDIWSLGVILYQLTTGKLPFRGRSSTEIIANMFTTRPEPPSHFVPTLPAVFDDIVMKCLRLDPSDRFGSVAELAKALAPLAPASASFTLERISRYATAEEQRQTGAFTVPDPSLSGIGEEFFTPAPPLPTPAVATASAETNETISSAPTRVMPGAAIPHIKLTEGQTQVMPGAALRPLQEPGTSTGMTKLMPTTPVKTPTAVPTTPSEFSAARTNVLGPTLPRKPLSSTTEVMAPGPPQTASPGAVATAPGTASTSEAGAWNGAQTLSWHNKSLPKQRMWYLVAGAMFGLVLVIVALSVALSGSSETSRNKAAASSLAGTTSGATAHASASVSRTASPKSTSR